MKNILANLDHTNVFTDPFPHIYAENVLPDELVDQLINEFPPLSVTAKGREPRENTRLDYSLKDLQERGSNEISPLWQEFMAVNGSKEFVKDLFRLAGDQIVKLHPHLSALAADPDSMRVGVREVDSFDRFDILANSNIGVNTPIKQAASSVRSAHIDDPRKLYGGLLYLRSDADDSTGGDFVIYRYKDQYIGRPEMTRQQINMYCVEEVKRVPYKKNSLVLFINSIDAVHGVTPRNPTEHERRFLNITGDVAQPLFDIAPYQEQGIRAMLRRVSNKLGFNLGGVEQRK